MDADIDVRMGHVVENVPGLGQAASLSSSNNTVLSDPVAAHHDSISASGQSAVLVPGNAVTGTEAKIVVAGGETFKNQVHPLTVLRSFQPNDDVAAWQIKELKKERSPSPIQNKNKNKNKKKRRAYSEAYPVARTYQTLTPDKNGSNLYLVGGLKAEKDSGHACKSMFALDSRSMTWKSVPVEQPTETKKDREKLVGPRFAHTAHFYTGSPASKSQRARGRKSKAGCILVYGGYASKSSSKCAPNNINNNNINNIQDTYLPKNTIHAFDIRTQKWNIVSPDNTGPRRAYHASVILNDRYLVVHGGCTAGSENFDDMAHDTDTTHIFDLIKASWFTPKLHPKSHTSDIPTRRRSHSAANGIGPHKDSGVFFGGALPGGEYSGDLYTLTLVETENNSENDNDNDNDNRVVSALWKKIHTFQRPGTTIRLAAPALVACEENLKYFVIGGRGKLGTQGEPFTIECTPRNIDDIDMPESIPLRLRMREENSAPTEIDINGNNVPPPREDVGNGNTPNGSGANIDCIDIPSVDNAMKKKTKNNNTNGSTAKGDGDTNGNGNIDPEADPAAVKKQAINGTRAKRKHSSSDKQGVLGKRKAAAALANEGDDVNRSQTKRAKARRNGNGNSNGTPYGEEENINMNGLQKSTLNGAAKERETKPALVVANETRIGSVPMKVRLKLLLKNPKSKAPAAEADTDTAIDIDIGESVPMSSIGSIKFSAPLDNGNGLTISDSSSLKKNATYRHYVKETTITKGRRGNLKSKYGHRDKAVTADGNTIPVPPAAKPNGEKEEEDNDVQMNEMETNTEDKVDIVAPIQANGIAVDKEDVKMDEMETKTKDDVRMKEDENARAVAKNLPDPIIRETMEISDDEGKDCQNNKKKITTPAEKANTTKAKDIAKQHNGIIRKVKKKKKKQVAANEPPETARSDHFPEKETEIEVEVSSDATTDDESDTLAEMESLRDEVKRLTKDNKHLNTQLTALRKSKRAQSQSQLQLQAKAAATGDDDIISGYKKKILELEGVLADYKEENQELEADRERFKEQNRNLAAKHEAMAKELKLETFRGDGLNKIVAKQQMQIKEGTEGRKKLAIMADNFAKENGQLKITIVRLENENDALKKMTQKITSVSRNASAEDDNQQHNGNNGNGNNNNNGNNNGNGGDTDADRVVREEEVIRRIEKEGLVVANGKNDDGNGNGNGNGNDEDDGDGDGDVKMKEKEVVTKWTVDSKRRKEKDSTPR